MGKVETKNEEIDLSKPMTVKKVIGFNTNKRKSFNQIMTKSFNSIKCSKSLNEIYNFMYDKIIEQESQGGKKESPSKEDLFYEYLYEKLSTK